LLVCRQTCGAAHTRTPHRNNAWLTVSHLLVLVLLLPLLLLLLAGVRMLQQHCR
jgi:hypothetical protein